jgi:CubicO group peptidase (beta-lactamase class C family)
MPNTSGKRLSDQVLRVPMTRRRALGVTAAGMAATGSRVGARRVAVAQPATVPAGWPGEMPDYASLAAAVQGEAARWHIPGIATAIVHDGERTRTAAGVTNLEHPAPVTPDTRFQIGSISKVVTATAVMALVDQGVLDLDAPVTDWVPDLPLQHPDAFAELSLRHLLNHTTGFEGDYYFDEGDGDDALARGVARFGEMRVWTRPGEVVAYCNTGFSLAGRIIELATGMTYEEAIGTLVFAPLGMETSSFPTPDLLTRPTASGHAFVRREDGYIVHRPWALPRFLNAAGGIVSTVDDLLTFAEMHMRDGGIGNARVLSKDAARQMRERTSASDAIDEGYGVGWNILHAGRTALVNHGGATNGFRAWLMTVPEHAFAIAILTNSDEGLRATDAIERWALRHYLGVEREDPQAIASNPDALDAVTGRYVRHDAVIDVWREDDHLHVEHQPVEVEEPFSETVSDAPSAALDLWPAGETVFVAPGGPPLEGVLEFIPDAPLFSDGAALEPRQILRRGGRIAVRTGDAPASGSTVAD